MWAYEGGGFPWAGKWPRARLTQAKRPNACKCMWAIKPWGKQALRNSPRYEYGTTAYFLYSCTTKIPFLNVKLSQLWLGFGWAGGLPGAGEQECTQELLIYSYITIDYITYNHILWVQQRFVTEAIWQSSKGYPLGPHWRWLGTAEGEHLHYPLSYAPAWESLAAAATASLDCMQERLILDKLPLPVVTGVVKTDFPGSTLFLLCHTTLDVHKMTKTALLSTEHFQYRMITCFTAKLVVCHNMRTNT